MTASLHERGRIALANLTSLLWRARGEARELFVEGLEELFERARAFIADSPEEAARKADAATQRGSDAS